MTATKEDYRDSNGAVTAVAQLVMVKGYGVSNRGFNCSGVSSTGWKVLTAVATVVGLP